MISRIIQLFGISLLIYSSPIHSAAIRLNELGTADMGVANAGAAAVARDAGTVYFNPAGMTRFNRDQLVLGGHVMFVDAQFAGSEKSLFRGGDGGQAGTILPGLGAYYIHNLFDRLKVGLCINSPYGGMFNYGKTWKGRYLIQREFLPTLAINPNVAFKVTPDLSIGGGFVAEYGYFLETFALNPAVFGGNPLVDPDGRAELNMDSWAYGYNIGVLYEFSECTRVGITYRSKLRHKFRGRLLVAGPSVVALGVDTVFKFADFVIASLYHQLNSRLALLANIGWERWSVFDRTVLTSDDGGSFTIPRNWKNTWHGALGVEYRLCSPLLLQTGISYDTSPTTAHDRTPDLPVDRQLKYALGLIYSPNDCEKISAAFEYFDGGRAPINFKKPETQLTLLKGHYSHNQLFFINFSYSRKF